MKRTLFSFYITCGAFIIAHAQITPAFNYTQTCYGNQTTLVASSSLPDISISSWQWDLDGNGTYEISGKKIISLFTMNDTNIVMLKITPTIGAADSIADTVFTSPLPQVNFMANNLCESKVATYISLSTVSTGSIAQWKWDFNSDGADDATGNTVTYVCGPAQTYTTQLTCVSDKGCSAFTQKITTVYPNPTAAFSTSNACVNANATFTNTSAITNLDFYLWNFGDGSQAVATGNTTHNYSAAGNYTVTLIAATQKGCRDTAASSITIHPLPTPSISGNLVVCLGNGFTLTASGGTSYVWNPTGQTNSTLTTVAGGTYSVTTTDNNGCTNTASATTVVNPLPIVSITASDTVLHAGSSMILVADGASRYAWSTGASSNNITVTQSGTYSVMGTDMNNCIATDSIKVMNENPDIISVFGSLLTPNDDNINDVLMIDNISAYSNCYLKIYTMWNDEVFSVSGYRNDWKGTDGSGATLPAGAYYYIIQCDDKPMLKGNINILR